MAINNSRRSFLSKGTLASAASFAAASTVHAETSAPYKKLKIGVFGIDYTFWGLWADLLSPEGQWSRGDLFGMEMAYVWDKDKKKARDFADKWGIETVDTYDGMLGKVDGVINGGFYNVPWQHKLLKPYIEAGMPTYLSRPWSSCIRDLETMLEMCAKHNTPICATATHEHYNEADNFADQVKNVGEIEAVFATCGAGDRPHFHVPYMMMKILGYNVGEVSLMTNDPRNPSYLQTTYVYNESDNQPSYALSMHALSSYVYSFTIIGKQGTETASLPGNASYFNRFAPQLMDIQKTMHGATYQPLDIVRKKFDVLIAEYYSHYEMDGRPVKVGTVPADWQYPLWMPDWYDDSDFRS